LLRVVTCLWQPNQHSLPGSLCYTDEWVDKLYRGFRRNLNEPMILVGLDSVIVGNIDHFWNYCFTADKIALCRDPYKLERSINGIALVPAGFRWIWDTWQGENDMEWLRQHAEHTVFIDDIWPGHCLSLKAHDVRAKGLQGARVIYFHGVPKPHKLGHLGWIREHWS
jgi:hypothetical protein